MLKSIKIENIGLNILNKFMEKELKVNERLVRVTGSACIEQELEQDKSYSIMIDEADLKKITEASNNDGTVNLIYSLKLVSGVSLADKGEIIKAEVKGKSQSQKLRAVLYLIYNAGLTEYDSPEEYYQAETSKIIEEYKKKLN